ncbi:hypothetical protein V8F20_008583 [Naviculisporaceae sp. PSN 640]
MSVHSLDWDEVLNTGHVPKVLMAEEDGEDELLGLDEDEEEQSGSVHSLDWDNVRNRKYTPTAAEEEEIAAVMGLSSEGELPGSSSDSDENEDDDPRDYQPSSDLQPDAWGEVLVDDHYQWDWGEPPRDEAMAGVYVDPPIPTPLWRQEEIIKKMPEYKILHKFLYKKGKHDSKVKKAVIDIQEVTYYVLGLAHNKKLDPFQTNVLLWKHVSNIYRSLFHFAVATGAYSKLVDILVRFQQDAIDVVHPITKKVVEFEEADDRHTKFWRDLPGLQSAIADELRFITYGLGEGDGAASPDPRRIYMQQVITLTNEIITRCNIELPYKGRRNKSVYLQAGAWFKAAFGSLLGWNWPEGIEPNPGPRPKPNEWEIRGACYWIISGASWLLDKIEQNKQTLEDKPELKNDRWFPPWDHGGEVFHYPGDELYVDKYRDPEQWDTELWREWSKAKGLNEFSERSWDAWSAGLIAVLDANRQKRYDAFVGGKKLSKETEELVQKALTAMVDAMEQRARFTRFQEEFAVMSL